MMIEKELWGEIDIETYQNKLNDFRNEFGEPQKRRRLALRFGPNDAHFINTRIRITNGDAKIMQKIHELDTQTAKEYEIDIPNDANYIVELFNTYRRILSHYDDTHFYLLRFENYIYTTQDVEIKLTHQFGKEEIYSFEVEALEDSVDIPAICKQLGLSPDYNATTDKFWKAFNKRVNVDISHYSDEELRAMIKEFL